MIYTDGACQGNPGPGGWGALLLMDGRPRELSGGEANTTNNRMELMASIEALKFLTIACDVDLYTDSVYLRNGIQQWIRVWKRNNWQTAKRQPVKNQDLWVALDEQTAKHSIRWHWVKGHSGNPGNERADRLANLGMKQYLQ